MNALESKAVNAAKLRRFMAFLSLASKARQEKFEKKQAIRNQLERIKSVSLNKRSTKEQIQGEISSFEETLRGIINDEHQLLEEQRTEQKQINELKGMVEQLSTKLVNIGREYAMDLEAKEREILMLKESLAAAHIKISESGEDRQKRIEDLENKIKAKHADEAKDEDSSKKLLTEMEQRLKTLESKHAELKKRGKHSKSDLDKIKKLIDSHKDKITAAKQK